MATVASAASSSCKQKHNIKAESKWELSTNFLQSIPLYGPEDEDDNRPVLTTQCTWSYFWSLNVKQLSFDNGKVIVEEYPTYPPHGRATGVLNGQLWALLSGFMEPQADTSYVPAAGVVNQPDVSYCPQHVANPGPGNAGAANPQGTLWPTLVIEIQYKRGLPVAIAKANQWLAPGTGVQIVVIIKLYGQTANGVAMVALRFERGAANNPTYAVSFGTRVIIPTECNRINNLGGAQLVGVGMGGPACNVAGIAQYQFWLPTNLLTVGMPAIHVPAAAHFDFDLFTLQSRVIPTYV